MLIHPTTSKTEHFFTRSTTSSNIIVLFFAVETILHEDLLSHIGAGHSLDLLHSYFLRLTVKGACLLWKGAFAGFF